MIEMRGTLRVSREQGKRIIVSRHITVMQASFETAEMEGGSQNKLRENAPGRAELRSTAIRPTHSEGLRWVRQPWCGGRATGRRAVRSDRGARRLRTDLLRQRCFASSGREQHRESCPGQDR